MNSEVPAMAEAADVDFPLYVLADEESGDVLVAAEGLEGFFATPGEEPPGVAFLKAHRVEPGRRKAEDAVLRVVNRRGERIGEYFIGRVVRGAVGAEASGGVVPQVEYRFFGNRCEYPEAEGIWRRWASGIALEKGEWLRLPAGSQDAWLHVVQNSWFTSGRRAARYGADDVVHLDGALISTKAGFFCALGEAVNGPGGYFGSNLDALADCLSSSFGEGPPARVVWRDFPASRASLGVALSDALVEVLREFTVDLVTG